MKRLLILLICAGFWVSCKDQNQTVANQALTAQPENVPAASPVPEGTGKVTLMCGSQRLTVEGKCGGDTTSGDMIVAVQDKNVPARIFTITFNGKDYPESGKTYTIRKSDFMSDKVKPQNEIYVGFSEMTQKNQLDWSSDDNSGTLQFEANGNAIKCTFKDIKLQPSMMYNKGGFDAPGTASGTMTFYKN